MAHLVKGLVAKPEFDSWTHGGRKSTSQLPSDLNSFAHMDTHCQTITKFKWNFGTFL